MNLVSFGANFIHKHLNNCSSVQAQKYIKQNFGTFSKKAIHVRWCKTNCNIVLGKHK